MNVSLEEVTRETLRAVCKLDAGDDATQVAPNAVSIAEASFYDEAWFRAIYDNDALDIARGALQRGERFECVRCQDRIRRIRRTGVEAGSARVFVHGLPGLISEVPGSAAANLRIRSGEEN